MKIISECFLNTLLLNNILKLSLSTNNYQQQELSPTNLFFSIPIREIIIEVSLNEFKNNLFDVALQSNGSQNE